MNESLHESEHFIKMLSDFMPGMVGYWTKELRSTYANREYLNWLGKSKEEMSGIAIQDLLGESLFRKHEPYIRAALAGESQTFDYTLKLPNEEIKETLVHYIPHHDNNAVQGLFVLILDMTERRRMEQTMISMAEERQRLIGRELHDSLGQQIAAIAYQTQALEKKILASGSGGETAKIAASIAAQAQNAVKQCSHLARGLLPLELESNSLLMALHQFAQDISGAYEISCRFEHTDDIDIQDNEAALNFYRIAQEASHNAVAHGKAKNLTISLTAKNGKLRLAIRDDGCGITQANSTRAARPGMGIKIMQYRANQIGATLQLVARPEGGSEVLVERKIS